MLARFVNALPNGLSQRVTKFYFLTLIRNQRQPHSTQGLFQTTGMDVKILPALSDNYMYLLIDTATKHAAIVDPVEPKTVMQAVQEHGVHLTAIMTTHHHWDHAGGNEEMAKLVPGITIYGADTRIGGLTQIVQHDSRFNIGQLYVQCLYTPCHTSGHICYFVTSPQDQMSPIVFTGDTLFLAGCGRFFEGTAEQMYTNLIQILSSLPDETKVFCGHEYSLQNLKFASFVEPTNKYIKDKIEWCTKMRKEGKPTVPSTIAEEKLMNPFMRVMEPTVMKHAKADDPINAMRLIRLEKDTY